MEDKPISGSLLSFDQVVKIDPASAWRLVGILILAVVLIGLTLRLVKR